MHALFALNYLPGVGGTSGRPALRCASNCSCVIPGASATSCLQALPSSRSVVPSSNTTMIGNGLRVVVVARVESVVESV